MTYGPVLLQNVCFESIFVGGNRAFPAPVQNQPFILIGWKCSASHPLPWKLHLRPDVYIDVMLSKTYNKKGCYHMNNKK